MRIIIISLRITLPVIFGNGGKITLSQLKSIFMHQKILLLIIFGVRWMKGINNLLSQLINEGNSLKVTLEKKLFHLR